MQGVVVFRRFGVPTCLHLWAYVQVELDSGEFETLSDALRNLLLAPPYQPARGAHHGSEAERKRTNAEYHVVQVIIRAA
jgi:hypothetical protein